MLTNNDPAAAIRQGLLDRGIPAHVADGFLMNFRDESGLRTDINEAAPIVPGSRGGFGLAQWTGPRRRELEAFAQSRGVPASDMNAQLDFLMAELQGSESRAAQSIFAAPDSATAADAILRQFLRPAAEHRARRSAAYLGGQAMPFAQPQGGQQPMQQQPGLLATMSTMNQQPPRDPSIWDALVGRLPERAQGFAGRTIGDADWRDRMAIGLAGMSMRPNEALIDTLQGRMDDRSQERRINQTVQWLQSIGRTDLAEAVAAGSLMGDQAAAIALQPAPTQEPTALMQNYEFLLAQGYAPQDALAALNAGTVVNVGGDTGPQVGTIPPGAALVADPSHPSGYRIEPIPGGPLAAEQQAAEAEALAAETRAALNEEVTGRAANVVIQDIGRLSSLIENAPWYNPAVGAGSGLLEGLRGTNAADAKALAVTIRANIGFDRLQQMRESSPTGGALGQVAVQELEALQGVLGSLDTAQSEAQFLQNLNRLNTIYTDIMRKFAAYPNAAEFGITMPEGSIGVSTLPPSSVRTYNPATRQLE
jgi:hypothetical protein